MKTLIGPFAQIITLRGLPLKGAIKDTKLEVILNGGVVVKDGCIRAVGEINALFNLHHDATFEEIGQPAVLLPGFIDCHTHMCFAGKRSVDFAKRIAGESYIDIANSGGGIWDTVEATRNCIEHELLSLLLQRVRQHESAGITTIEIKSGYGLNIETELKMLRVIKMAAVVSQTSIISTCLAAHIKPLDFAGDDVNYLQFLITHLLPLIKEKALCKRADIFIEQGAFCSEEAARFLIAANLLGFSTSVHADQFTAGGSSVAISSGAHSVDHLEASSQNEIDTIANSNTTAVVLPGASLGLGMPFAPARKLLDAGACLAIASDWNPGSAPQGDLIMQASILSASQKINTAETLAGLTFRAAQALRLSDRGIIDKGMKAHMQAYATKDFRDILYYQGKLKPFKVWK